MAQIRADKVRECTLHSLPRLQELQRDHADWIERRSIDLISALLGDYRQSYCSVSHRWEAPDAPDVEGKQLAALKAFLRARPEIEYVWYDFACMPQGADRTAREEAEFRVMFNAVEALYLGAHVVVLAVSSCASRFWTAFEVWMSTQSASETSGLRAAPDCAPRCTVVPLDGGGEAEELVVTWAARSAQQAHEVLAGPEMRVTHQSDKEGHLLKLRFLEETARAALAAHLRRDGAAQLLARAMAAKDLVALEGAIEAAVAADMAQANVRLGREAAYAIASAGGNRRRVMIGFAKAQRAARQEAEAAERTRHAALEAVERAWQVASEAAEQKRIAAFEATEVLATNLGVVITRDVVNGKVQLTGFTPADGASEIFDLDAIEVEMEVDDQNNVHDESVDKGTTESEQGLTGGTESHGKPGDGLATASCDSQLTRQETGMPTPVGLPPPKRVAPRSDPSDASVGGLPSVTDMLRERTSEVRHNRPVYALFDEATPCVQCPALLPNHRIAYAAPPPCV